MHLYISLLKFGWTGVIAVCTIKHCKQVKLDDSEVLEKVRKGKPRVQKAAKPVKTRADSGVSQFVSGIKKKLPKLSSAGKLDKEMKPLLEKERT